jgi:hypothetical protein
MSTATAIAIEPSCVESTSASPIKETETTNVVCPDAINSVKGFLGRECDNTVAAMPSDQVAYVKGLRNEELFPLGERALKDICDDIIVLNEIRNRFYAAKGQAVMGYASWREFVERNSAYCIRTVQRRLNEVKGVRAYTKPEVEKPVPSGTTLEMSNQGESAPLPESAKVTVEEGKVFGNLIAHKQVDVAPYDRSSVWLVENTKTGKAELWRACDLTHIERDGTKNNDLWHWGYTNSRFKVGHGPEKMLEAAQEGLADIKAGTFDQDAFAQRLAKIYGDAIDFVFLNLPDTQSPKTPSLEVLAQCIRRFGDCSISQSRGVHHLEMKLIGLAPERLAVALEAFNAALGSCDEACIDETVGGAQ